MHHADNPDFIREMAATLGLDKNSSKDNKELEPVEAEEAWFKAYWEGNATLPQSDTGVTVFLAASLLESPSLQLDSFSRSRLSTNQLQRLGEMMSRVHRAKSIDIVSTAHTRVLEPDKKDVPTRVVPMERFLQLWESAKIGVLEILQVYTKFVEGDSSTTWQSPDTAKLGRFFIENEAAAVILKNTIIFIRDAFKSPAIKDLLSEYRSSFKDPANRGKPLWVDEYKPKFVGLVTDLAKTSGSSVSEKVLTLLLEEVTK